MNNELLRDKFIGALLGVMAGDVMGAPVEGWEEERLNASLRAVAGLPRRSPERALHEAVLGLITGAEIPAGAARYTDDTQMTLGVAESLCDFPDFDGPDMARRFVENFEGQRGYGIGAYSVLLALKKGAEWNEPARRIFGGRGSWGNGAAMRAAPVGLLFHKPEQAENLRRIADLQAQITHTHALGREGAILQAASVAVATRRIPLADTKSFDAEGFLNETLATTGNCSSDDFAERFERVRVLLRDPQSPSVVAQQLGNGIEAVNSVPAALYSFLAHPLSLPDAISYGVRLGGDADTIGAMCGAIAGAYHGARAIPAPWLTALENGAKGRDYAASLGARLCDVWASRSVQNVAFQ